MGTDEKEEKKKSIDLVEEKKLDRIKNKLEFVVVLNRVIGSRQQ